MAQSIGQKFTPVTLLKFALPSMVMMVLMSCYTITDGIFISRFLGDNALSAVNIVYPVINIVLAIGVMLATGGSAVVAKKMGEGKDDEAKDNFSMLVFTGVVASVVILILTILSAALSVQMIRYLQTARHIFLPLFYLPRRACCRACSRRSS